MKRFKLASRRERWGLTIYGWLLILMLLVLIFWGFVRFIVPFLSVEETMDAKIMVVEGYVPDYAYPGIIRIFREEDYEFIVTSGTSFDQGFYIAGVKTAADLIRNSLLKLGFDSTKVVAVPVPPEVYKDRTWHSALYTFNYLREHFPDVKKVNIVSLGPHARRSKYLFEMVYEPEIELGNIVIPHVSVRANDWYTSSRGFRTVLNESIAYLYARLFFRPDKSKDSSEPKP